MGILHHLAVFLVTLLILFVFCKEPNWFFSYSVDVWQLNTAGNKYIGVRTPLLQPQQSNFKNDNWPTQITLVPLSSSTRVVLCLEAGHWTLVATLQVLCKRHCALVTLHVLCPVVRDVATLFRPPSPRHSRGP